MRPLLPEEIAPLEPYAAVRDAFRGAVIDHKRRRRMGVGPSLTLVFEDRETLRFQVQEMLWVERIRDPAGIQKELDVYNELMPGPRELSATLFVEITDPGRIRAELDRLIGIDEHVALLLGAGDEQTSVPARFDAKQFEEDRISAVQYLRFPLEASEAARLADPTTSAAIRVAHPAYHHVAPIPPEVRESLVAGLEREPASLLPPLPSAVQPESELLFENEWAQVLRPEAPPARGALVVVARGAADAPLEAEAWSGALEQVRRVAVEMVERFGGCRVVADVVAGSPPRWTLLPQPAGSDDT